jgi:hypothetical protein
MSPAVRKMLGRKAAPVGYSRKATFVFILGMHRSGTSCLAGSLERCGLFLGRVKRTSLNNPRGNHELSVARRAHGRILRANGGSWRRPPPHVTVNSRQKQFLQTIAAAFSGHEPCGIKDPRFLLLLEHWLDVVDPFTLVGTFRHPIAVARSLNRRGQDPFPEEEAYQLWLRYNAELIRWHEVYHFPLIEFDLSDAEAYVRTVATMAIEMGLHPAMERLRTFVSSPLDHHQALEYPVPEACQEAYAYLRQHRYQPDVSDSAFAPRLVMHEQQRDRRQSSLQRREWWSRGPTRT